MINDNFDIPRITTTSEFEDSGELGVLQDNSTESQSSVHSENLMIKVRKCTKALFTELGEVQGEASPWDHLTGIWH